MRSRYLESVERVMDVLGCFTPETPELRLTDLSQRLNMPKSQVHRIASTLVYGHFLAQDTVTKRYRLGIELFHLGMIVRQNTSIHRISRPHLKILMEDTQETAGLVVPDDSGPICFDQVESPQRLRVFSPLGKRLPWYADTSPKLLLAFVPEEERDLIMARDDFRDAVQAGRFTLESLRCELQEIRERGYYVGMRDRYDGGVAVSAPVFDHGHHVVGAVNVSAPSQRLTGRSLEYAIERVAQVADSISQELGFRPVSSLAQPNGQVTERDPVVHQIAAESLPR